MRWYKNNSTTSINATEVLTLCKRVKSAIDHGEKVAYVEEDFIAEAIERLGIDIDDIESKVEVQTYKNKATAVVMTIVFDQNNANIVYMYIDNDNGEFYWHYISCLEYCVQKIPHLIFWFLSLIKPESEEELAELIVHFNFVLDAMYNLRSKDR